MTNSEKIDELLKTRATARALAQRCDDWITGIRAKALQDALAGLHHADKLHALCLKRVETLILGDPEPESDAGKELVALGEAIEAYETSRWPTP